MNRLKKAIAAIAVLAAAGCSEANRNTSPVELQASTSQTQFVIDLINPAQSGSLGTINMRAVRKSSSTSIPSDARMLDVKLQSYRVTYRRTDGGTQVPAPLVRTTSGILPVGGAAQSLNDFLILSGDALNQAPFVAIMPNNGGIDPETGQRIVKFDAIIEIFGETLSGQSVYARTVSPLWVCAGCTL